MVSKVTAETALKAAALWHKNQLEELTRFIDMTGDKAREETRKAQLEFFADGAATVLEDPKVKPLLSRLASSNTTEDSDKLAAQVGQAAASVMKSRWKTTVDQRILIGFPYSISIVTKMALVYGIMLLEEMFKEYLRLFLIFRPKRLRGKLSRKDPAESRSLAYSDILAATSVKQIRESIIEKELYRLGRMDIDEMDGFFMDVVDFKLSDYIMGWSELRAAYYTRNLAVHNRSVMNQQVHSRINLCPVGESVVIDEPLVADMVDALSELNKRLYRVVSDKTGVSKKGRTKSGAK